MNSIMKTIIFVGTTFFFIISPISKGGNNSQSLILFPNAVVAEMNTDANVEANAIPALLAAWGVGIFKELVDEGIGHAKNSATGWVFSLLGFKDPPDPSSVILSKLKVLEKKVDEINDRLIALDGKITKLFVDKTCKDNMLTLSRSVSKIMAEYNNYSDLAVPTISEKSRLLWAERLLKNNDVSGAIVQIHMRLVGTDAPQTSLLSECSKVAYMEWQPTSGEGELQGKYGNERFYYDRVHSIVEYYLNVQVLGAYLTVTAYNLIATDFAKKEGAIKLEHKTVAQQVCGDVNIDSKPSNSLIPTNRTDACTFAKRTMLRAELNLRQQVVKAGAGYSYAVRLKGNKSNGQGQYESDPEAQHITSVKFLKSPQLWVTNPKNYPSAYNTRKLETIRFAGIDGWRGAGTADWNQLLDGLDKMKEFDKPGRERFVDRTLMGALGFSGFSGYSNNGEGAVIWMDEEVSEVLVEDNSLMGFCFLIPYSKRGDNTQGLGKPLCNPDDMEKILGYQNKICWETRPFLLNAVTIADKFWFGKKYKPGRPNNEVSCYSRDFEFGAFFSEESSPQRGAEVAPGWFSSGSVEIQKNDGRHRSSVSVSVDERPRQIIFPVFDIDEKIECVDKNPLLTSDGVPTMCGKNLTLFAYAVVKKIKK